MIWLPESVRQRIGNREFAVDDVGMSGSTVMTFDDMVLKVGPIREENRDSLTMLDWLKGKLPVPQILCTEDVDGTNYLLMSRIPGEMSCEKRYMEDPRLLTKLLAEGLRMLWSVDISDCPCTQNLDKKLTQAARFVADGECSLTNVEPGTYGEGGFKSPAHLLQWLEENRPQEDLVLSHGDYCLPNVFVDKDRICGFIDLDHCGTADKYHDIALCYRSLLHNSQGKYGYYPNFHPEILFEELEMEPDWEKIRYYILLDELF